MRNELFVTLRDLDVILSCQALADDGKGAIRTSDINTDVALSYDYEMTEADFVDEVNKVMCSLRDHVLTEMGINPEDYFNYDYAFEDDGEEEQDEEPEE